MRGQTLIVFIWYLAIKIWEPAPPGGSLFLYDRAFRKFNARIHFDDRIMLIQRPLDRAATELDFLATTKTTPVRFSDALRGRTDVLEQHDLIARLDFVMSHADMGLFVADLHGHDFA